MMYAAVVVMTVLGCGDQAMSCDFIAQPKTTWQNKAQCEAAVPAMIKKSKNAPYPTITAQCAAKSLTVVTEQSAVQAVVNIPQKIEKPKNEKLQSVQIREEPTLTVSTLQIAQAGYGVLKSGAKIAVNGVSQGAAITYSGVQSSIRGTGKLANRSVGLVRDRLGF